MHICLQAPISEASTAFLEGHCQVLAATALDEVLSEQL